MSFEKDPPRIEVLFIPVDKIRQACVDINTSNCNFFRCWVDDVFYLKASKFFAVSIKMQGNFPCVVSGFKEKWEIKTSPEAL